MTICCPSSIPLVFVDEGLGYCRHPDRNYVLFYTLSEPPTPAFSFAGKPSGTRLYAISTVNDNPTEIARETLEIRRRFVDGWTVTDD